MGLGVLYYELDKIIYNVLVEFWVLIDDVLIYFWVKNMDLVFSNIDLFVVEI